MGAPSRGARSGDESGASYIRMTASSHALVRTAAMVTSVDLLSLRYVAWRWHNSSLARLLRSRLPW